MEKLLSAPADSPAWARGAVAAMRLERFRCDESKRMLLSLLDRHAWQLRCFAANALAVRRIEPPSAWLEREEHPRVIRTIARCGWAIERSRLRKGVEFLRKSSSLDDRLLSVEIAAAAGDSLIAEPTIDTLDSIVLRMSRTEAGVLSSRLAAVTGSPDHGRDYQWREWWRKNRKGLELRRCMLLDVETPRSRVAEMSTAEFAELEAYLTALAPRQVDLAVALDCTASMFGELAQAQGGIDQLMQFVADVCASLRFGLVAYRDQRDRDFEVRAWDLTPSVDEARTRLWSLSADGGGDRPESVHAALKSAYTSFSWDAAHTRVMVLVGDAPPHPGTGTLCVDLARRAADAGIVTHVIQARLGKERGGERGGERTKDVVFFREISTAGRGRCVSLEKDDSLVVEIAGLTLGERFEVEMVQLFRRYLATCR